MARAVRATGVSVAFRCLEWFRRRMRGAAFAGSGGPYEAESFQSGSFGCGIEASAPRNASLHPWEIA